jgi:hypothetical protein
MKKILMKKIKYTILYCVNFVFFYYGSGTVIIYGSGSGPGSAKARSYDSGSASVI